MTEEMIRNIFRQELETIRGAAADEILTPAQVAEALHVTADTLATWRHLGKGPHYIKLPNRKIRYRRDAVDEFTKELTVEVAR